MRGERVVVSLIFVILLAGLTALYSMTAWNVGQNASHGSSTSFERAISANTSALGRDGLEFASTHVAKPTGHILLFGLKRFFDAIDPPTLRGG